jgi:hypothetical protein
MNEMKYDILLRAIDRYERIYPCSDRNDFNECFTVEDGRLLFWFNTEDQSTHVMSARMERGQSPAALYEL